MQRLKLRDEEESSESSGIVYAAKRYDRSVTSLVCLLWSVAAPVAASQPSSAPASSALPAGTEEELPSFLTLDEALRLFRQRGFDLLIADAAVHSAEGDVRASSVIPNPVVNAGIGQSVTCSAVGHCANSPFNPLVTAGISDNAAIEDSFSGKRYLRMKAARAALASAKGTREAAQRALELAMKLQYLQTVLARAAYDFAVEVAASSNKTFELNQWRFKAGAISEADVAKIEAAKLEADQAVDGAEQNLRQAKVQLAFLLGVRGPTTDYTVDTQVLLDDNIPGELQTHSLAELLTVALKRRGDLKAVVAQEQRAQAALSGAKRAILPDFQVGLQYTQQGLSAAAITPPTLEVTLTTPLPVFYQQRGEIIRAEADVLAQQATVNKTRTQVLSDVQTGYSGYVAAYSQVERMQTRLLERVRRARDLVRFQYEKGAASLLEFLDAQRTYVSTNLEYFQDLENFWTAVFQLEQAVGVEFK